MKRIYDIAKGYYNSGAWSRDMIENLFIKGKLSQEECDDILGPDPEPEAIEEDVLEPEE